MVLVVLETPRGQRLALRDRRDLVEIRDANGNSILLDSSGITLLCTSNLRVVASQVDISGSRVQINSAVSRFSGVVQCDTLITNSVVSSSYTPGAGNIW